MKTALFNGLTLAFKPATIRTLGHQHLIVMALVELPELKQDKSLDRLAFTYASWIVRLTGAENEAWYCSTEQDAEAIHAAFRHWLDQDPTLYEALAELWNEAKPKN
jgi:hypothetical protein